MPRLAHSWARAFVSCVKKVGHWALFADANKSQVNRPNIMENLSKASRLREYSSSSKDRLGKTRVLRGLDATVSRVRYRCMSSLVAFGSNAKSHLGSCAFFPRTFAEKKRAPSFSVRKRGNPRVVLPREASRRPTARTERGSSLVCAREAEKPRRKAETDVPCVLSSFRLTEKWSPLGAEFCPPPPGCD